MKGNLYKKIRTLLLYLPETLEAIFKQRYIFIREYIR